MTAPATRIATNPPRVFMNSVPPLLELQSGAFASEYLSAARAAQLGGKQEARLRASTRVIQSRYVPVCLQTDPDGRVGGRLGRGDRAGFRSGGRRSLSPDVETAAHKLAGEILDTRVTKQTPPFTSDTEHARSIDPVLTRDTAIWIHEELPSPPLTVVGGRVFSFRDHVYDPLETPVLKIRPIDDEQTVPFLVRVVVTPDRGIPNIASITLAFPAPPIFNPRLERVQAWVGPSPAEISIERTLEESMISVRIPLAPAGSEPPASLADPVVVIVQGELRLGSYQRVAASRFADLDTYEMGADIANLATIGSGAGRRQHG